MSREVDVFLESHDGPVGRLIGDDHGAQCFRCDPDATCSIAREAYGGAVADVEPLDVVDVRGLLVRRFDREAEIEVVRRIHQEDFARPWGYPVGSSTSAMAAPTALPLPLASERSSAA